MLKEQTASQSIVAIPFRLEATKLAAERAKGAFYDHYLTRTITGHPTTLLKTDAMNIYPDSYHTRSN